MADEYVPVRLSHLLRDCSPGAVVRGPDSLMVVQDTRTWDRPGSDPDLAKRLFYVMIARARERVFLFMKRGEGREIEKILPSDRNVLRRREL